MAWSQFFGAKCKSGSKPQKDASVSLWELDAYSRTQAYTLAAGMELILRRKVQEWAKATDGCFPLSPPDRPLQYLGTRTGLFKSFFNRRASYDASHEGPRSRWACKGTYVQVNVYDCECFLACMSFICVRNIICMQGLEWGWKDFLNRSGSCDSLRKGPLISSALKKA